jgi:ketosteroid isomerase-like protein
MDLNKRQILAAAALAGGSVSSARAAEPPAVSFAVWSQVNAATQGYADCLDRFDMDGLRQIFAADCVYEYSPSLTMTGQDEVVAGARKSLAGVAKSSHFVGPPNVQAGPEPGLYSSVVYFTAFHEQKDGDHHTMWGRYVDVFKPDASGRLRIWRRQTLAHVAEGPNTPHFWLMRTPS